MTKVKVNKILGHINRSILLYQGRLMYMSGSRWDFEIECWQVKGESDFDNKVRSQGLCHVTLLGDLGIFYLMWLFEWRFGVVKM